MEQETLATIIAIVLLWIGSLAIAYHIGWRVGYTKWWNFTHKERRNEVQGL